MSLKLYSAQNYLIAGKKVEVLADVLEIPLEVKRLPRAQWQSPQYLQKHPLGKVPTLETPQGCIFQSLAILRYLARKAGKLYGNTPTQTARIDEWLEFYNTQFQPSIYDIYRIILAYVPSNQETYTQKRQFLEPILQILEQYLTKNKFLGSQQVSIADIAYASGFVCFYRLLLDQKLRNTYPSLTKWFNQVTSHPAFAKNYGKIWPCQAQFIPDFTLIQPEEPKKVEKPKAEKPKGQKGQKGDKGEKQKAEKPKKEQKPQPQKKPKEQKKKKEKEQDSAEETQVVKKTTNPLDELPKSPFNLDDWKRQFVNTEDKQAGIKQFWNKFDPIGWSIWKTHYIKYQGQGVVGYLTANLKNGFLRNLDHFRKYTFGVLGVYGIQGNFQIDGAWLWRGTQIPNQWKQHQSYDYFQFAKLDHTSEDHRRIIQQYWLRLNQGDMVDGHPVFQAKWFK